LGKKISTFAMKLLEQMNRKIKLIWDFRGPNGLKTAEHHCVHLNEFTAIEKLAFHEINVQEITEYHSIAYVIVDEKDMLTYRDALKPHRGAVAP
tara:strand:- start:30 stop:311 length:282 start_codon:yes stop_codon:yes gene_type:complete